MGFFAGIAAGISLFIAFGVWFTKRQQQLLTTSVEAEEAEEIRNLPTVSLEKKLRDAIYDCERQLLACEKSIANICKDQLDLLEAVGKRSHVEVKDKPLFFAFHQPLTKEQHFYYQRDLHKDIPTEVLEQTKAVAQQYQQQIDRLLAQRELFNRMIHSHQENIQRLNGINKQHEQSKKISQHRQKIANLNANQQLEEKAIYNELLLKGIEEELEHQDLCIQEYQALKIKFDTDEHTPATEEAFKIKLQSIIESVELKDPERKRNA